MPKNLFDADAYAKEFRDKMGLLNVSMRTTAKQIGCSVATISRIAGGKPPEVENYLRINQWMKNATDDEIKRLKASKKRNPASAA